MEQLKKAFTLVEIMIIIGIILVLAALAIPNLLRSKMFAREAIAANLLRIVAAAETQWRATNSEYATLAQMAATQPPYIDSSLASGLRHGYTIEVEPNANLNFYATAAPQNLAQGNTYYIDEGGILCRSNSSNTVAPVAHSGSGCPAGFSEVE